MNIRYISNTEQMWPWRGHDKYCREVRYLELNSQHFAYFNVGTNLLFLPV